MCLTVQICVAVHVGFVEGRNEALFALETTNMSFYKTTDEVLKLRTLRELPKIRYSTDLAVTAYPNSRRGRKGVFSHVEALKMVETIAGRMRECGVRPGTICAYALPTSFEAIIFFYALMWIGAIAAPIDPELSKDEFEDTIRNTGAAILVYPHEGDDDNLEEIAVAVTAKLDLLGWGIHRTINEGVKLETYGKLMGTGAAWAGGAGDFKIDPDEICLHITSAVAVVPLSHGTVCNAVKAFTTTYGTAISGSTMMAAPLHSIHGIIIMASALYFGGHVVLPGRGGFIPEKFWEMSKTHNVTWLSASEDQVISLYEDSNNNSNVSLPKLQFIRIAGRCPIAAEVVQAIESSLGTKCYESYGPVESSGFATTNRDEAVRLGSLGAPVAGVSVATFSEATRTKCGQGEVGEIAVSGLNVAQSYYNSPTATESAIFETEETGEDGESKIVTWFATGDRGRIDEDGNLTVVGNSRELRAAELALMEERRKVEAAEAEKRAVVEAEERRIALVQAEKQKEEDERVRRFEDAARKEREAVERAEKEKADAALLAADRATASRMAELDERERKLKEMETLSRMGFANPEDLDEETANAILRRLEQIEANHKRLQADLEERNAVELEEMRRRVQEAEEEAAAAIARDNTLDPVMIDVRMEELEAAVMAAAASAESSANNTREAVKAAREVAQSTQNSNRSQPVDIKASTGDQGALTKTVRVALDEVEKAMEKHPAVRAARAFGRKDKKFGAEVFCAIVPKKGARVSEPWLKLFAQSQLAAAMVPKKFFYLSKMPENMTRKELSESPLLQDLSQFSGFTATKPSVKGPNWKSKQGAYSARNELGF